MFTACITEQNSVQLNGTKLVSFSALSASSSLQLGHTPHNLALWHRRIMHHKVMGLLRLVRGNVAAGVAVNSPERPGPICKPCLAGKMDSKAFPSTGMLKYASNLYLYDLIRIFIAFRCLTPLTSTGTYAHRLRALLYICPAFFLVCSDLFLWL
jgi:hypothetical protein